jgi:GLPGLI family protein
MKNLVIILLLSAIVCKSFSQQTKIVSDCTIIYSVSNADADSKNDFKNASKTIYIRGKQIRIDINSNAFDQTIFYNDKTGEVTVLKSIGATKYMSTYNAANWQKENSVYKGIKVSLTNNRKKILGYDCKEAILHLQNGNTYIVYYIPGIVPSVTENDFEFKEVPGLVLQYEASIHNEKIRYTATYLNFDPVPAFKFEIPKSGYKILN